ncbi:MAG: phosphate acyltransferase PlsX [Gammaproteobacteria bacterium]|nr:phosphate acyltransferase PlsX [Gammaproteobacteria bacterium]
MKRSICIAIDAMSGDYGAQVCVPASLDQLKTDQELRMILVGQESILRPYLENIPATLASRVSFQEASQLVTMDEDPRTALRKKKDSSMRVAINLVRDGLADACVSAGNTGALMATARFVLRTLPGIDRPAIISTMPAIGGHTHMLDLGANSHCTAVQLFQFGVMGSVVASDIHELESPRVGLLNIGVEAIKGTDLVREAGRMLNRSNLNYVGFVEANDIFTGQVDVVVSDGFAGNVALKTLEGAARLISSYMRAEFTRSLFSRIQGLVALPVLKAFRKRIDPRRYNGASLVGLNGIVVKSHGSADRIAFGNAIQTALIECQQGVPTQISNLLEKQAN